MQKKQLRLITLLVIAVWVLSACGGGGAAPAQPAPAEATKVPEATQAPTETPTTVNNTTTASNTTTISPQTASAKSTDGGRTWTLLGRPFYEPPLVRPGSPNVLGAVLICCRGRTDDGADRHDP